MPVGDPCTARARRAGGTRWSDPGRAHRHGPLLRRVQQRPRRLSGHHGSCVDRSRHGYPLRFARSRSSPSATSCGCRRRSPTRLGIRRWRAVVGGSMGGMQALEWAVMYPDRVGSMVLASTTAEASALQIAWSHIGRMAVEADPGFRGGDYYDSAPGEGPHRGLAVARMTAQVTYRSDEVFTERFHRSLTNRLDFTLDRLFEVESYLDYHGLKLVRRFDANSYVRLNRAMDLHDLGRGRGGVPNAIARVRCPSVVAAVRSDGLYPPSQQAAVAQPVGRARRRQRVGGHRLAARPRRVPDRDRPTRQADRGLPRSQRPARPSLCERTYPGSNPPMTDQIPPPDAVVEAAAVPEPTGRPRRPLTLRRLRSAGCARRRSR